MEQALTPIDHWWNDPSIPIVEIDGRLFALSGWNGRSYRHCWEVEPHDHRLKTDDREYIITPV